MNWKADENGITIKKLIGSKSISYSDLTSILIEGDGIRVKTKDGEKFDLKKEQSDDLTDLCAAVKKFNIAYKNAEERYAATNLHTVEEVMKMAEETKALVYSLSRDMIRKEYGPEYDIRLDVEDVDDVVTMYFTLLRDGKPLPDMASWDEIILASLMEWDPSSKTGKYALETEMEDPEECRITVKVMLEDLFANYTKD